LMPSPSQLITILVWERNLLEFNFEHFHCPRRPNPKNLSREIQTSRQTVHEYQTIWNSHHGHLSAAEFVPHSGQPCFPSNTRGIDGQSICTGTLWISCSLSRILLFQSLSGNENFQPPFTQFPLCGQSHHDALSRLETTPTMGYLYSTWFLQSTNSIRRSWWFWNSWMSHFYRTTQHHYTPTIGPGDLEKWPQSRLRHSHPFSISSQAPFDHSLRTSNDIDHTSDWRSSGHFWQNTHSKKNFAAHHSHFGETPQTPPTTRLATIPQISTRTSPTFLDYYILNPRILDPGPLDRRKRHEVRSV